MKYSAVFFTVLFFMAYSDAFIKWHPSSRCVDCFYRLRWGGERYYDGCNWCTCGYDGVPSCTYMDCRYNRCFKKFRRY